MGSLWICGNGHEFTFIPKGKTRPGKCPVCGNRTLDVREV